MVSYSAILVTNSSFTCWSEPGVLPALCQPRVSVWVWALFYNHPLPLVQCLTHSRCSASECLLKTEREQLRDAEKHPSRLQATLILPPTHTDYRRPQRTGTEEYIGMHAHTRVDTRRHARPCMRTHVPARFVLPCQNRRPPRAAAAASPALQQACIYVKSVRRSFLTKECHSHPLCLHAGPLPPPIQRSGTPSRRASHDPTRPLTQGGAAAAAPLGSDCPQPTDEKAEVRRGDRH